jgi:hypothetical protein
MYHVKNSDYSKRNNTTPVDAKLIYASCLFKKTSYMPESRLCSTAAKYNAAFGAGAFVFGSGFCRDLQSEVPALLLDSTPLDMSGLHRVLESDACVSMTIDAMRAEMSAGK